MKISTILILTYFIKNDIIINKMFHDEQIDLNDKDKIFFMDLYLLLLFISYIWLVTLHIIILLIIVSHETDKI